MRTRKRYKGRAGLTLTELVTVMAVIGILLASVLPNLRGSQHDAQLAKCDVELNTLKAAVTSYWRHHGFIYPPDIHSSLTAPNIIPYTIPDPFNTDATHHTYGYLSGVDDNFGPYFILYTRGPRGDTVAPAWDSAAGQVTYTGSGRVVSNAPVLRQ